MRLSPTCQQCLVKLRPVRALVRGSTRRFSTNPLFRRPDTSPWQRALPLPLRRSQTTATTPSPTPAHSTNTTATPKPYKRFSEALETKDGKHRLLLQPDNLFHPMDTSPSPSMRERAAYIKRNAYCPHPQHREKGVHSHVSHTCPDCGVPVYCSEDHLFDDYENHLLICDTLREVNEDEHDLRSGRFFPEFDYPGEQMEEQLINMTNWDTLFYTRNFNAINADRQMRQVTKVLTYPLTITSFVHELSPYNIKNRLTQEGLKSLAALRYSIHPPATGAGRDIKGLRINPPPVRIFILGARAESSLPREVWHQLTHMFARASFHLIFIGPESMLNRESEYPLPDRTSHNPFGAVVERVDYRMKISTFVEYYHTLHDAGTFAPLDPYFDLFVMFHPGLGHPGSAPEWEETLPRLLETKIPVLCTGFTEEDMIRDVEWVEKKCKGEYDILMTPGENRFKSLRWDMNDADPTDLSQGNWGIWAFRGKRYEAQAQGEPGAPAA